MIARTLLALVLASTLSACGLQPIYAGGSQGIAASELSAVDVAPIEGRTGWLVTNALRERINVRRGETQPRYRIDIQLDDRLESLGLLTDDTVTRERRTLRARYQLVDLETGTILLDATAGSDAGIDVVSSEFATIAAEQTAVERLAETVANQIITRVSLTLRDQE